MLHFPTRIGGATKHLNLSSNPKDRRRQLCTKMQALRSHFYHNYRRYAYQKLWQSDRCDGLPAMKKFTGLPTELLLMIIVYLPIDDLACLSFCNHRLLELSQWRMAKVDCNKDEKLLILNRLERAFPQYFACRYCLILHKYDGSESFGLSSFPSMKWPIPCYSSFNSPWAILRTHRMKLFAEGNISFLHVKLAMRRFLYGPQCGINTDSLRHTQVQVFAPNSVHSEMISMFTREAQICPNHPQLGLSVRMQDIILVDKPDDLIPRSKTGVFGDPDSWTSLGWGTPWLTLEVCRHISFAELLPGIVALLHNRSQLPLNIYRCEDCNTDSRIEIQEIYFKTALVITRWVALGQGISEDDPLWKSHACWTSTCNNPANVNVGNPRMCFEDKASESFRELMFRNLFTLRDKGYEKEARFCRCGPDHWFTPYGEPRKTLKTSLWRLLEKNGVPILGG